MPHIVTQMMEAHVPQVRHKTLLDSMIYLDAFVERRRFDRHCRVD